MLGPVRAWSDGMEIDLGTPQSRLTLAVLLLRGGSVLVDELVQALWPSDPPRSAVPGVRTFVSRLRRSLAEAGHAEVIQAVPGGYRMAVVEEIVDTGVLRAEIERAALEQEAGDLGAAAGALRRGLAQWQGTPLGDLDGHFAEGHRALLHRLRLSALEQLALIEFRRGRPAAVVSTLTTVIDEYPFDERLRELLMLGLWRAGQQADALDLYTRTRRLLNDELGIGPGAALQRVHQQILASAPVLSAAPARQLPADLPDLTGRRQEAEEMAERLINPEPQQISTIGLTGLTGTGKTALAVHVGHAVSEHFPDGQIFVPMRDERDRPLDPFDLLSFLLISAGSASADLPATLPQRAAAWRSVLANRRMLVILDDAQSRDQVSWLLPGGVGSAVIVTSQRRLDDPAIGLWLMLEPLPTGAAVELVRRIVSDERVERDLRGAERLVTSLSGLPSLIRCAGLALQARPHLPLDAEVAIRWPVPTGGQGVLSGPATAFRRSYGRLPPRLARALRLLSLVDGGCLTAALAGAVMDVAEQEAQDLLEELADRHFLILQPLSGQPPVYEYPIIVRQFANAQALAVDGGTACAEAARRLRRWQAKRRNRPIRLLSA